MLTSRAIGLAAVLLIRVPSLIATGQEYPRLTGVMAYEELLSRRVPREVTWTDPDGVTETIHFLEMAIPVDRKLTMDFEKANYGKDALWVDARIIVFHAMGDGDLKTSLEVSSFLHDHMPPEWGNLSRAGRLPNGSHFIIDKDGTIICLTPPYSMYGSKISYQRDDHRWMIKRHQDGNPVAIGIENVTDRNNWTELTPAQIESNATLARWLIWMEKGQLELAMSHHQFNDENRYDSFLKRYSLKHLQKAFRTRDRKDIGDTALKKINTRINQHGNSISLF